MRFLIILCVSLISESLEDGFADQVFRKIHITEGTACYRLMNGTHQFGCQGTTDNQNGVLVKVQKTADFENLRSCYRATYPDYNGKFWVMVPIPLVNRQTISIIRSSNCTSGLVFYDDGETFEVDDATELSQDSECPNEDFNYYYKSGKSERCAEKPNWKAAITPEGIRNIDWGLQMVYIENKTEVEVLNKCYSLFNEPKEGESKISYPYCGMAFKLGNNAAGNSEICYRRGLDSAKFVQLNLDLNIPAPFCSPLTGHNVFAWPMALTSTDVFKTEPKYLVIGGRMDSFGLIPEISPGEISVLTSLISVISAAKSIGTKLEKWTSASKMTNRYLMFAVFNGESFDYIGSGSTVYRMRNGEFPLPVMNMTQLRRIDIHQIDYILEVQQIGYSRDQKMYAHVDGERYKQRKSDVDGILKNMEENLRKQGVVLNLPAEDSQVPPSSWHSFASYDERIQSIVISPFGENYEYKRYNSMLDKNVWDPTRRTKAIDEIVAAASAILTASATYVGVENASDVISIDRNLVVTLFDCLVVSDNWFSCDFMKKLNGDRFQPDFDGYNLREKSTYVSARTNNPYVDVVHWLFIFALGSSRETLNVKNKNSCMHLSEHQAVYSYDWQPNPYTGNFSCLRSSIQYIQAQSPAFEIDGYSLSKNSTFSTWTESIYMLDSVKLFLLEDHSFDYTVLIIAVVVAILSIFAVGRCTESTFIIDEGEQAAESGEPL